MKNGFTILELLGAILVISIGVLTAYGVVQTIVTYTIDSSDRFIAAHLAKEGVELVRNIRDSNWVANPPFNWNQGLGSGAYEISYDTALISCPDLCVDFNSPNLHLLKISESGYYNYSTGTDSKFKRKITLVPDGADKLKIIVDVFWKKRNQISNISVQENIYEWK